MALEGSEKKVGPSADASPRPLSPKTGNPKSLKPKRKIVKRKIVKRKIVKKSSDQNSSMTKDSTAAQIQGEPIHEKSSPHESIKENNSISQTKDDKKKNSLELNKEKSIINENSQRDRKVVEGNEKKVGPSVEASSRPLSSKTGNLKSLKPKRKIVKKSSDQNSSRTKDPTAAQIQGKPKHEKNSTHDRVKEMNAINQTKDDRKKNPQELNKEKSIINENSRRDRKDKEELGGLVFMCNGKTKPDCFRYGVMGVPLTQKELVLGIKPGLKLFLYDFDLKLMYGIYEASFAGGIKLEPAAFGGAFPAQVRFKVHKDCFPVPESVFKRAIEDNYDEKKRFKTQLTVLQVKKLTSLFQASPHVQSNAHFIQAPPQPELRAPPMPTLPAGELSEGRREPVTTHREVATLQEEAVRLDPLFLTEKQYRTYGLSRERSTLTLSSSIDRNAPLAMGDLYQKDREREQLPMLAGPRHRHRDTASRETDQIRRDTLFLSEKDYRAYGLGQEPPSLIPHAAVANNASTVDTYANDPYPLVPRRETYLTKSDYQERGSTDFSRNGAEEVGGLYSRYASNALQDYNEKHHNLGGRHEFASTSVTSRYSFDGPSLTYR